VVGAEAGQVLRNGLKLCDEYQQQILEMYGKEGDLETVAMHVARRTIIMEKTEFISEDVMVPVARAEVRNILKAAGRL
jgi:hypothetical protein